MFGGSKSNFQKINLHENGIEFTPISIKRKQKPFNNNKNSNNNNNDNNDNQMN